MSKKKVTGKVVKVRRARKTLPISKKLLIVVVIIAVMAVSTYGFTRIYQGSTTPTQTLKPYDILKDLATVDNISAVLVYIVTGDLDVGGKVLGIYDKLVFIVQPTSMEVPSNGDEGKNVTVRYYLVRYDTTHYLTNYLLSRLGINPLIRNLSDFLVDKETLASLYQNITLSDLGLSRKNIRVLGDVEVHIHRIEADDAVITVCNEVVYGLPVEVTYYRKGYEVRLTLDNVDIIKM
ncbi:MAG: hypothetical protein QXY36_01135 [Sulfolobales archaeon]